jgi:hypothetical protein
VSAERHDYPHDGSEVLGTVSSRSYRCTRGNCGQDIGLPANQDEHNATSHCSQAGGGTCNGADGIAAAQRTADAIVSKWNDNPRTDPTQSARHMAH